MIFNLTHQADVGWPSLLGDKQKEACINRREYQNRPKEKQHAKDASAAALAPLALKLCSAKAARHPVVGWILAMHPSPI